jgi:hypothetical protein
MIIVCGDSFTCDNLIIEPYPDYDYNFPKWTACINAPVKNLAQSGLDNRSMINSAIEEILINNDVSKVIIALGNWYRFTLPHAIVDPEWAYYNNGFALENDYMTWLKGSKYMKVNYEFNIDYCNNYNWHISNPDVMRFSINQTLVSILNLYEICKSNNIILDVFQLLKPIRKTDIKLYELFITELVNNKFYQKLDSIDNSEMFKLMYWPFFDDMGGECAQSILDSSHKVGKLDGHPNRKGHEMIGAWYNENST